MHSAKVNAKPDNATGELVHHHENPIGPQCGRFGTEQIAAPQTVLIVFSGRGNRVRVFHLSRRAAVVEKAALETHARSAKRGSTRSWYSSQQASRCHESTVPIFR